MWIPLFAVAFGIAGVCHAAPLTSTHTVHEKLSESGKWRKLSVLNQDELVPMRIGMRQSNMDKGYDLLMRVSDPDSPNYGQYYTQDQITKLFSPCAETQSLVKKWLTDESISEDRITHSDNHGWYAFDAKVSEAERLLRTKFYIFEHLETGHKNVATDFYHIPNHLVGHIDYITPGVRLHAGKKQTLPLRNRAKNNAPSSSIWPMAYNVKNSTKSTTLLGYCDREITPSCIRALYEIPFPEALYGAKVQPNNALGIYEFGDVYLQENLNKFFRTYTPWIPQGTHPTPAFIDGAEAPGPYYWDTGESDLDFSLAYPLIYPQKITLFQTDDARYTKHFRYGDGLFNTFLDAIDGSYCTYSAFGETGNDPTIDPKYPEKHGYKGKLQCGVFKPTSVISISYGTEEANFPLYYQKRQCNEFLKLALQGVSVLIASGDNGVAGRKDHDQCLGSENNIFSPPYPANCPYLTSVGATEIPKGRTVADPEVAADDPNLDHYSSGGGFSNVYETPAYQEEAVHTYLTQHTPPYPSYVGLANITSGHGLYNRRGRGIPDVSANGLHTVVYTQGRWSESGGTSAATPIFASVLNRINEKRLAAGKSTVGFVNTALYKNPGLLNDVFEGHNPGCKTPGFKASKGWDPVTGLGTPNFKRMSQFFMSLQ